MGGAVYLIPDGFSAFAGIASPAERLRIFSREIAALYQRQDMVAGRYELRVKPAFALCTQPALVNKYLFPLGAGQRVKRRVIHPTASVAFQYKAVAVSLVVNLPVFRGLF